MNENNEKEEQHYILKEQKRGKYLFHRCQSANLLQKYVDQINKIKKEYKQSPKIYSNKFRNLNIKKDLDKLPNSIDNHNINNSIRKIKHLKKSSINFYSTTTNRIEEKFKKKKKFVRSNSAYVSLKKKKIFFNDELKPKGLDIYNSIFNNEEIFKNNLKQYQKNNEKKIENLSSHNIEKIMNYKKYTSDNVFNQNKDNKSFNDNMKLLHSKSQSDIFFIKDQKDNLKFKIKRKPLNYSVLFESSNEKKEEKNQIGLINHNSIKYYIYNPSKKSFTKTKDEITHNSLLKKPGFKQALISKYLENKNSGKTANQKYNIFYNYNKNIFHKNKEILSQYSDTYKSYRNLSDWPFKKKMKLNE